MRVRKSFERFLSDIDQVVFGSSKTHIFDWGQFDFSVYWDDSLIEPENGERYTKAVLDASEGFLKAIGHNRKQDKVDKFSILSYIFKRKKKE